MYIQPISHNQDIICKSKKKPKFDKIDALIKLGATFTVSGGVRLPENASAETIAEFNKILSKDCPQITSPVNELFSNLKRGK